MNLGESKQQLIDLTQAMTDSAKSKGVPIGDVAARLATARAKRNADLSPLENQMADLEAKIAEVKQRHEPEIAPLRDLDNEIKVVSKLENILKENFNVDV